MEVFDAAHISKTDLSLALPEWLKLHHTHTFIRTLLGRLVFLDLDQFEGSIDSLIALQPRCLTQTSPNNLQAWICLDETLSTKTSLFVQHELTKALGGDPGADTGFQQGRLPGSTNVKTGKNCAVRVLYSSLLNLGEARFLELVPPVSFRLQDGKIAVKPPRTEAKPMDRSAADWRMACSFFEENAGASESDAMEALKGQWLAQRANMDYYIRLTVSKAKAKVGGKTPSYWAQLEKRVPKKDSFKAC